MIELDIGDIGNYYGGLRVKADFDSDKFFWSITNYNGDYWEEIPKYLFIALMKFREESERQETE